MDDFRQLDRLLRNQEFSDSSGTSCDCGLAELRQYASMVSKVENVIAVLSDLKEGRSDIFLGGFAEVLGIEGYSAESSIWEKVVLSRLHPDDLNSKYFGELNFLHFLDRQAERKRGRFYFVSKLRMRSADGTYVMASHRMYYFYDSSGAVMRFALCLYGAVTHGFDGANLAVDSLTGNVCQLITERNDKVLSQREKEVLSLIDKGYKSAAIAEYLSISKNTVSRHRQEILAKLKVKNSIEACRVAKLLGVIR